MTDLHVGKGGRIYLDGNLIDQVVDLRVDVDQYGRSTVTMEFQPTSVIYGDLPQPVVEEVLDAHTPVRKGQGVDMERAMENARRRARGEPVGAPVKDQIVKKTRQVTPSATFCHAAMIDGGKCSRPLGHTGPCRDVN